LEAFGAGALRKAVVDGDVDNGSVMAGQIAGLVNKRESCKDIIEDLMKGYQEVVKGLEL
ncbi:MAG: enoyl-[acyl-carrier-protein] reductase FabK, partial [Peptostreptococcus sp.]|nr:enoyl-[acyl-carrier-protein] reductase FabK [Peptostreptococcus sp.]